MNDLAKKSRERRPPRILPGRFPATDLGNAERLVALNRGEIRYCVERRKWLVWGGTRWHWDNGAEMHRRAKEMVRAVYHEAGHAEDETLRKSLSRHATKSETASRIAAALSLAQFEEGIPVSFAKLDADPWLLNCENGTLDLRNGELREHDRGDLITKSTRLSYLDTARSGLWRKVLSNATGGEKSFASYLQRVAGYACAGVATERFFLLLFGQAGTGKSAFLDALLAALGDYAVSADAETFLAHTNVGGNRGDLVRLAGTRLVVAAEIRKGARWDESIIKRITGGDELVAAAKYEGEVTYRASCTLVLAANDSPTARDDDSGFWARCRRVPFAHVIQPEHQIRDLKDRLREPKHATAILAWAVQGCLDWQKSGIGTCEAVEKSTEAYFAESNRFGEFVAEEMVLDEGQQIPKRRFRDLYENWCRSNGCRPKGDRDLKVRLTQLGVRDAKSGSIRLWKGIGASNDT